MGATRTVLVENGERSLADQIIWILLGLLTGRMVLSVVFLISGIVPAVFSGLDGTAEVVADIVAALVGAIVAAVIISVLARVARTRWEVPAEAWLAAVVVPLVYSVLWVPDALRGFYAPLRGALPALLAVLFAWRLARSRVSDE